MTQDQKDLLMKDISARFPYGVKVHTSFKPICTIYSKPTIYSTVVIDGAGEEVCNISDIKPYLFPLSSILSSMTEEQYNEYTNMAYSVTERGRSMANYHQIDWFHKNNIDYRGLIPMGLAIDATGLNIY